jgi:hypothetical protein
MSGGMKRESTATVLGRITKRGRDEEENEYKADRGWDNGDDKTLCYWDIVLLLLPNPESIWDLLAMEVNVNRD